MSLTAAPLQAVNLFAVTPVSAVRHTEFLRESSAIDENPMHMTPREERRIEHFLGHMFPVVQMRRYAREIAEPASFSPISRHVSYAVIEQEGVRFVMAGYRATWNGMAESKNVVNELAIYRMEPSGPNQVWRSRPWQASYPDLHFLVAKSGSRNVVLFQEGGSGGEFGLASVFSFYNAPKGLLLHDLTPSLPWLRASERFPFRTLYGRQISMRIQNARDLILSANDQEYNLNMSTIVRPGRSWLYNRTRGCFERMKSYTDVMSRSDG